MTNKDRIDRRPGSSLSRQSTQDLLERRTVLLLFLCHHHADSAAGMTNGTDIFCIRRPDDHGGADGQGARNDSDQFGRAVSDDDTLGRDVPSTFDRSLETIAVGIGVVLNKVGRIDQGPNGLG